MDYIQGLRIFRTVVEAKSFSAAADMLGLTPPIVSRAIAGLEKRFETRLFHRTTRTLSITEPAQRVYERCCKILDDVDALDSETIIEAQVPTGVLKVVAHTTAMLSRFVPLISTFKRRYPDVSLELTMTELPVDLVSGGFDLGVVMPHMLTTDLTVTRLLERIPLAVVATKSYLDSHSTIDHPASLVGHQFIMNPLFRKDATLTFITPLGDVPVKIRIGIAVNNAEFVKQMVLQGFGVGALPLSLVEPEIRSGRLTCVLPDYELRDGSIEVWLAYNDRRLMPAKVRAFIDHASSFLEEFAYANEIREKVMP